jgi:hypothetical protein
MKRGGFDVHEREMRLAVLLDPVGEGFDAPHLGLGHRAACGFDDTLVLLGERLDLL